MKTVIKKLIILSCSFLVVLTVFFVRQFRFNDDVKISDNLVQFKNLSWPQVIISLDSPADFLAPQDTEEFSNNFHAALMKKENYGEVFVCNLFIVSMRWFLTTGTCGTQVKIRTDYSWYVLAGINDLSDRYGFKSIITKVVIHNRYNEATNSNNIALVQSMNEFGPADRPNGMAFDLTDPYYPVGSIGLVYGWGKTGPSDEYLNGLKVMRVAIVDSLYCAAKRHNVNLGLLSKEICVLHVYRLLGNRSIDACYLDEGSVLKVNGQFVAMRSYGNKCIPAVEPAPFVDLSWYFKWIRSHVIEE